MSTNPWKLACTLTCVFLNCSVGIFKELNKVKKNREISFTIYFVQIVRNQSIWVAQLEFEHHESES